MFLGRRWRLFNGLGGLRVFEYCLSWFLRNLHISFWRLDCHLDASSWTLKRLIEGSDNWLLNLCYRLLFSNDFLSRWFRSSNLSFLLFLHHLFLLLACSRAQLALITACATVKYISGGLQRCFHLHSGDLSEVGSATHAGRLFASHESLGAGLGAAKLLVHNLRARFVLDCFL